MPQENYNAVKETVGKVASEFRGKEFYVFSPAQIEAIKKAIAYACNTEAPTKDEIYEFGSVLGEIEFQDGTRLRTNAKAKNTKP